MKTHGIPVFLAAFFIISASAQPVFDVKHYAIALNISDLSSKSIRGCCTIGFQSRVSGLQRVELSLLALTVDFVTGNGSALSFVHDDTILAITLPQPLSEGDTAEVVVCYHGQPVEDASWGGFYFSGSYAYNIGVAFTSEPHTFGRVWFPCVDNFTDRATYEMHITTAAASKAVCSGLPLGFSNNPDGTVTWHWKLNEEIPTYLASVAVAGYASLEGKYKSISGDSVPYILAALPADTAKLRDSFIHLSDAFDGFEDCYGQYRFGRVGFVVVPFSGGAMEHATNIAYPRFAVTGGLQYETLMAHEFSHHWFGDLVTCATPQDMWLNEGWASYSESIFLEKVYGKEAYKDEVRKNHKNVLQNAHIRDDGYRAVSGVPHEYTYGSTVYDKGADVAHTLRGYMGDSLFFRCLKEYFNAFKFNHASSYDFRDFLSQCSGIDLMPFFDNWVFAAGFPHFSVDSFFTASSGSDYEVTVFIRQRLRAAPAFYSNVPLELTFFSENFDSFTTTVLFSGACGIFHTTLSFEPAVVVVDLNEKISDAITDNYEMISATGTYTFDEAMMTLTVTQAPSPAWVRVEHNWVAPDPMKTVVSGLHISDERYWKVDGIIPNGFTASATISYDGTATSGYLDQRLITNDEDSLVMLFRPDGRSDWAVHPDFTINTQGIVNNKRGQITINNITKGQYVLGIRDYERAANDTQLVSSPCFVLGETETDAAPELNLQVFPNPAKDSFYIRFDTPVPVNLLILVFDMNGRLVTQLEAIKGTDHLHVSALGWSKTVYVLRIETSKGAFVKKVFVLN